MKCEQLVHRWMRNFIRRARELLLTYLAKGETEIAVLFSSHSLTWPYLLLGLQGYYLCCIEWIV